MWGTDDCGVLVAIGTLIGCGALMAVRCWCLWGVSGCGAVMVVGCWWLWGADGCGVLVVVGQ